MPTLYLKIDHWSRQASSPYAVSGVGESLKLKEEDIHDVACLVDMHPNQDTLAKLPSTLASKTTLQIVLNSRQWLSKQVERKRQVDHLMTYLAVEFGNKLAVQKLLKIACQHGLPYVDIVHNRLLTLACSKSYLQTCKAILGLYPETVHDTNSHWAPLESAIERFRSSKAQSVETACTMMKLFLEWSADPNAAYPAAHFGHGYVLQEAVRKSWIPLIKALLDHVAILADSGALQLATAIDDIVFLEFLQRGADVDEILTDMKSFSWDFPRPRSLSFVHDLGDVNENLKRCPPFASRTRQTN